MRAVQQLEAKGRQEGIQEGMQKGMQKGMQTRNLEIAKTMLRQLHLDVEVVQQATGLSRQEIALL